MEDVDTATLAFGPADAVPSQEKGVRLKDVNNDGFTDLLSHYRIDETGIAFGEIEACVKGVTIGGKAFEGCDRIETVPAL